MTIKLAILASTNGTDIKGIVSAIKSGNLDARIELIITNKKCGAVELAKVNDIPHLIMPSKGTNREEYDQQLAEVLDAKKIELTLLIGYMRYLSEWFVDKYKNKVMNIHPSLLPEFAGGMDLNVHEEVLKAGVKKTGCTLHFVDEGKDSGPIILQKEVPIETGETTETLKKKVQAQEVIALIEGIKLYAEGKLSVANEKVTIANDNNA